jgi:hypothetical protein
VLLRADGFERMLGVAAGAPTHESIYALAAQPVEEALVTRWRLAIAVLTPLLGLCVAPWLTLVFRNVTAGLVFTLAVPSALWIAGQIARAASVGFDFVGLEVGSPFGYQPALVLMIVGVTVVSMVAAVHGRALFVGLEALDTPRDLRPTAFKGRLRRAVEVTSRTVPRRRGPLLSFVRKEVRLYGLTFALAGLYSAGWIALWLAGAANYLADDTFETLAAMYGAFIAMLIGALSVAEERAIGTADTQRLLPWPLWKQATAKLATVGVMSLLLGLAIPVGLEALLPLIESTGPLGPDFGFFRFLLPNPLNGAVAMILLIALFSCYVSSLCVGGLRALLAAMPLSFGLASLYVYSFYAIERFAFATLYGPAGRGPVWKLPTADAADFRIPFLYSRWVAVVAFVGFVTLLAFLFVRNFRSGEWGAGIARKQLPWFAVYAVLFVVLLEGGEVLLQWWLLTH